MTLSRSAILFAPILTFASFSLAQSPVPSPATLYLQSASDRYQSTVDVYTDADAAGNHFAARGEIHIANGLVTPTMDEISTTAQCLGITCITATFNGNLTNWGGWYFQNGVLGPTDRAPSLNWGTQPNAGYDLTRATSLQFWAKGAAGGEKVEFFAFGIGYDPDTGAQIAQYPDSAMKASSGTISLTPTWTEYTIPLTGIDIHYVLGGFGWVASAQAQSNPQQSITFYIDNVQFVKARPSDPRFLVSYETIKSSGAFDAVERNVAYVYDNAVALIALVAAGDLTRARTIADSLLYAQANDRFFTDGRLRNAYQGGDIALPPGWLPNNKPNTVRMPGWYDAGRTTWFEDETQVSSNTGNIAWAMLALLTFYDVTKEKKYLDAVDALGNWVINNTTDTRGNGGFTGGYDGWENGAAAGGASTCASNVFVNGQCKRLYKATEHNIDLYAAFSRLYKIEGLSQWQQSAQQAKTLFLSMWDPIEGKFYTGTGEDGVTVSTDPIPLDIQVWSLEALGADAGPYLQSLDYIEANHKTVLGYGFKQDGGNGNCVDSTGGDSTWFEGTSQVALAYRLVGNTPKWNSILDDVHSVQLSSGAIPATDGACLNTGFTLNDGQPWEYFPRAHVGATAWLSLAEQGVNPFGADQYAAGARVQVSPTALTFAGQVVGSTSASSSVVFTNIGSAPLTFSSVSVSGSNPQDFPIQSSSTCIAGVSIPEAGTCVIAGAFAPTSSGSRSAVIFVSDNALGSPQTVPLSGTGTTVTAGLQPTSLTFSNEIVGSTSAAQSVTLSNSGTGALTISSITITGANSVDFAQTNTCGSSVGAAGRCTINVTFKPTAGGARSASISVSDNAAGSPQPVPLSGIGTTVTAGLQPTSLTFVDAIVGSTTAAQSITLSNSGTAALTMNGIGITGANSSDFSQVNTCGSSVAAGGSCTINVTFKPTATGARSASVSVSDNASGSPQTVPLSGTGTSVSIGLHPSTLTFANQLVGTTSTTQTITLSNSGTAALAINGIIITGTNSSDFAQTNTCGSSVAAGGGCAISVAFKPTAASARSASVSISDNASGSPQTVPLSGTGTSASIGFQPASLTFANQVEGTISTAQSITLSNSRTAAVTINGISITGTNSGDFMQTNTCGSSVSASGSCMISVTFTPTALGARSASVSVSDNASGSPQMVPLSGTGTTVTVALQPTSMTFPTQVVGTTSTAQVVTLNNSGTAPLTLNGITITGNNRGDFVQTNSCGSSVAVGGSCTISITFEPTAAGARTASISVSDNAVGSPQTISLAGTGISSDFTMQASPLNPTSVVVGQSGTSTITITSVNGFNSAVSLTCSGLPTGASCSFDPNSVTPTSNGTATATTTVTTSSSTPTGNFNVTITGTAGSNTHSTSLALTVQSAPDFTVSVGTLTPAAMSAGQSASATISVTSENGFNSAVSLTCSVSPTPSLAPGCSLSASTLTPSANGPAKSTLTITTTAATASVAHPFFGPSGNLFYAVAVPVPGMMILGAAVGSRSRRRRRLGFLAGFIFIAVIGSMSGCGGVHINRHTPPGTYTITIKGSAGTATHSTAATVIVQ